MHQGGQYFKGRFSEGNKKWFWTIRGAGQEYASYFSSLLTRLCWKICQRFQNLTQMFGKWKMVKKNTMHVQRLGRWSNKVRPLIYLWRLKILPVWQDVASKLPFMKQILHQVFSMDILHFLGSGIRWSQIFSFFLSFAKHIFKTGTEVNGKPLYRKVGNERVHLSFSNVTKEYPTPWTMWGGSPGDHIGNIKIGPAQLKCPEDNPVRFF